MRIGDEAFLVTSLIERCPKVMMLRELVRNALEAAATASPGERVVRIGKVAINGVPKLAIRNSGRGMDAAELFRMADLAASIRKEQALDRNFGMGAKVASLPSNRLGLRYRSCHDGQVHEALLGWRDGAYGRIQRRAEDGAWQAVLDVTDAAIAEGAAIDRDWTEVVLFGNDLAQDTGADPYAGAPAMPPYWLDEELAVRFFRIGDGVALYLHDRPFSPIETRLACCAIRHEIVALPDGVRLHYVHDAPLADDPERSGAALNSSYPVHGMLALLHRDELYDVARHHDWLHVAPVFGIPFGARWVSVFVELPDDHPAVPDGYRQFLRHAGGRQDEIACRDYAPTVHDHRPDWLIALVAAQSPSAQVGSDVHDALSALLRTLRVPRRRRIIAAPPPDPSSTAGHEPETTSDGFDYEPVPEILLLRDADEIAARGLAGRAGRYYPETHQLFLNAAYPATTEMRALLDFEFAWVADRTTLAERTLSLSEQSMAARVGRMLVFALSRQGDWPDNELSQAFSPHALSLAADDWFASLPDARLAIRAALGIEPDYTSLPGR